MAYPVRGAIYWVHLEHSADTHIKKGSLAVVVSNNISNQYASRVLVIPITNSVQKLFPFEVAIACESIKGKVLADQARSIDKQRLGKQMAICDQKTIDQIDKALKLVLQLA